MAFLAFREGVPCPSCGVPSDGFVPIVESVLRAYEDNVRAHGQPVPATLHVENLWDDYVYRGLFLLRALDSRPTRETEDALLSRVADIPNGIAPSGWKAHVLDYYREILRARRRGPEREK